MAKEWQMDLSDPINLEAEKKVRRRKVGIHFRGYVDDELGQRLWDEDYWGTEMYQKKLRYVETGDPEDLKAALTEEEVAEDQRDFERISQRNMEEFYRGKLGRSYANYLAMARTSWEGRPCFSGRDLARLSGRVRWDQDVKRITPHVKGTLRLYTSSDGRTKQDIIVEMDELIPVLLSFHWEREDIRREIGRMKDHGIDVEEQLSFFAGGVLVSQFAERTGVSLPTVTKDAKALGGFSGKGKQAKISREVAATMLLISGPKLHDLKLAMIQRLQEGISMIDAFEEVWSNKE